MNLDELLNAKEELDKQGEDLYKTMARLWGMRVTLSPYMAKDSYMIVCGENVYNKVIEHYKELNNEAK